MVEIPGLGVTHYPGQLDPGQLDPGQLVDPPYWSRFTELGAESGRIPAMVFADVDSWPAPMPAEWSDDNGARHEFLDWICLAGTMTELGRRFEAVDFVESHLFNSSKCFGVFPPA